MTHSPLSQAAQFVRQGDYRVDFQLRGPIADLLNSVDNVLKTEPTAHQDLAEAARILARVVLGVTW